MSDTTDIKQHIEQEVKNTRKNYTRTANVLFESYEDLRPQEKWLYINLVYLCGSRGTRHLSLRYIHDRTGISIGALSGSKDPAKNDPGMLRRLHTAGLIHAEIKKKKLKDGKETDQAQYHVTIADIWQLNESFFAARRSEYEHLEVETSEGVQDMNESVHILNTLDGERSENERERSENDTNIRLHSKTTDSSKITEEESDSARNSQTEPDASSASATDATLSLLEELRKENAQLRQQLTLQNASPAIPAESQAAQVEQHDTALVENTQGTSSSSESDTEVISATVTKQEDGVSHSQKIPIETTKQEKPVKPSKEQQRLAQAEQIVQFAEQHRFFKNKVGAPFSTRQVGGKQPISQRQRQIDAALKILKQSITVEECCMAYSDVNSWWTRVTGNSLTIEDMAAGTPNNKTTMRVIQTLEKLEGQSDQPDESPAPGRIIPISNRQQPLVPPPPMSYEERRRSSVGV